MGHSESLQKISSLAPIGFGDLGNPGTPSCQWLIIIVLLLVNTKYLPHFRTYGSEQIIPLEKCLDQKVPQTAQHRQQSVRVVALTTSILLYYTLVYYYTILLVHYSVSGIM